MKNLKFSKPSKIFLQQIGQLPQNYNYLMIFHFSRNNLGYLKKWVTTVPIIGIISIPYSERKEIKKEISKTTKVYSVKLQEISELIVDICRKNNNKKIILIEIGGYSAPVADKLSNVILSVEDTARGHERFLENEKKLTYPVVSIARTKGKKMEDGAVGFAIFKSVEQLIGSYPFGYKLKNKNILIMGFGGIGQGTAKCIKTKSKNVYIYDPKPELIKKAQKQGFICLSREESIKRADIIIGCSGYESVSLKDIANLKNKTILISGSSRQVEFPYKKFVSYKIGAAGKSLVEKFKFKNKIFYVVYQGQPINFFFDISLGKIFDIPMTLLAKSVIYGLHHRLKNKLNVLPNKENNQIVKKILNLR